MKKLYNLLALVITTITFAQAPQGFNYQATVRNSSGALIVNQNVYFKFNVMLNSQTSVPVFTETHYVPTDDLGQVNLVIGQGTSTVGSFSTINWGTGSYYLGIELNTGSGYVAMGTTQLLSVPYALYANSAGSTTSQGKTSIYLTGNITNAQAAAKIAAELGPYTENIYIKNTSQLTTVDLSALVSISTIKIENNSNLTYVNFNNLATIEDTFDFYGNSQFNSLSFPALLNCSSFNIDSNVLTSLNIPLLSFINNFNLGSWLGGNTTTSLNFPSVQTIAGHFGIIGLSTLSSLTFPVLHTLSGNISIQPGYNGGIAYPSNLTIISLPALTSCTDFYYGSIQDTNNNGPGSININNNNLEASIYLSSLNTCNSFRASGLVNLDLSNLISCLNLGCFSITNFIPPTNLTSCNGLSIQQMPNLTSLSFPFLTSSYGFDVSMNPMLSSLSFPALTSCSSLAAKLNALPSENINSLLHIMLLANSTVSKNIQLESQNPLAPPTGQGLIDKQTLINTGNDVITD